MANPEHTPIMNTLDTLTVILYRFGLLGAATTAVCRVVESVFGVGVLGEWHLPLVALFATITSANLHLYDPLFRWLFPLTSWLGLVMLAFAGQLENYHFASVYMKIIALGCFYAGFGMLAVKEYFCFKIPGLPLVPLLLAVVVLLNLLEKTYAASIVLAPAAILLLVLSIAKMRMPLHFDVGDKNQYGI